MATEIEETTDERNYAESSRRLTVLGISIEEAERELHTFRWLNPIPTSANVAAAAELEGKLTDLQRQRARLLPVWAELKARVLAGG